MADAQTVELDAILTACASSEQAGHSRRITRRLRTSRNTKTWRAAVKRRTDLNEIEKVTLEVGKPCTWRGRPGILRALDVTAGTCEVEFSAVDPETGDVHTKNSSFSSSIKKCALTRLRAKPITFSRPKTDANSHRRRRIEVHKAVKKFFFGRVPHKPMHTGHTAAKNRDKGYPI